jgi:hypothetical protein
MVNLYTGVQCPESQRAAMRDVLQPRDEAWDLKAAARNLPHLVIGNLVSRQWAVQDPAEQELPTAVSFDGKALHGFEVPIPPAPHRESWKDDGSMSGAMKPLCAPLKCLLAISKREFTAVALHRV